MCFSHHTLFFNMNSILEIYILNTKKGNSMLLCHEKEGIHIEEILVKKKLM